MQYINILIHINRQARNGESERWRYSCDEQNCESESLSALLADIVVALVAMPDPVITNDLGLGAGVAGVAVVIVLWLDFLRQAWVTLSSIILTKLCSWLQIRHYEHSTNLQLLQRSDDCRPHTLQALWDWSSMGIAVSFDLWVGHCIDLLDIIIYFYQLFKSYPPHTYSHIPTTGSRVLRPKLKMSLQLFIYINIHNKVKNRAISSMDVKANPDTRLPPSKKRTSVSLRRPPGDPLNFQQYQEHDPKQYRILIHCFSNNITQYYAKKHKQILGDLEEMYKVPLNREEKIFMDQSLDSIIDRNVSKLARDCLMRNSAIAKGLSNYYQSYYKSQKNEIQISTDKIQTIQFQEDMQIQTQSKSTLQQQGSKPRPFTSNRPTHKKSIENSSSISNKGTPIFRNRFNRNQNIYELAECGLSTENQDANCFVLIRENCRRAMNKTKFHGRYTRNSEGFTMFSDLDYEYAKNNYLRIGDENTLNQNNCENPNNGNSTNEKTGSGKEQEFRARLGSKSVKQHWSQQKYMTKTNLNKFFNVQLTYQNWNTRQKSIDEMDREKIQNKILSMNGGISANFVKPQGYKPKSKCWGAPVPMTGKIVKEAQSTKDTGKSLFSMIKYK